MEGVESVFGFLPSQVLRESQLGHVFKQDEVNVHAHVPHYSTARSCACCLRNQCPLLYHTITQTITHVCKQMKDILIACSRGASKASPPACIYYFLNCTLTVVCTLTEVWHALGQSYLRYTGMDPPAAHASPVTDWSFEWTEVAEPQDSQRCGNENWEGFVVVYQARSFIFFCIYMSLCRWKAEL